MAQLFGPVVRYGDYVSGAGPSPAIWGHMSADPTKWFHEGEDFGSCATTSSSGVVYGTGAYVFLDSGDTATQLATETGGVLRLATDDTDNDSVILTTGYNVAGAVKFTATKDLLFECRVRASSIATVSYFFGLAEEGLAADNGLIGDTQTAMVDKDFVGFRTLGDSDADTLDAVYRTASGTSEREAKSGAQDMVAATWYKLGLRYDASNDKVLWLVNGARVSGQTSTSIDATDFPDGEELAMYIGMKNGSGAIRTLDVDWWHMAMLR